MAVKTLGLDKTQALNFIYDYFKHFQNWISQSKTPTAAEFETYLTKNFQISSNGHLVGRSAADYLIRYQKFQKKYSKFEISKPLEEPLVSGNQLAIHYKVDLTTRNNQHKQVLIAAIATFEDNKLSRWIQVAHETGTGDWDK